MFYDGAIENLFSKVVIGDEVILIWLFQPQHSRALRCETAPIRSVPSARMQLEVFGQKLKPLSITRCRQ